MPHYSDGTEAKVGDHVAGKLYNTDHEVAGTIISITPGADSCNCLVQYLEAVPLPDYERQVLPKMAVYDREVEVKIPDKDEPVKMKAASSRIVMGENHGAAGDKFVLFACADYSAIKDLKFIGRPAKVDAPAAPV